MPFTSGRVSFCRFRVTGDAPSTVDEALLSILSEFKFRETEIGAPDEIEAGFITGVHLYDTQFSYDKNGYGDVALFAIRLDTNKPPSEVKQAYKKMNEMAAAAGSETGFASKSEKREAKELAERQIHEDLAAGKYRKSKIVEILWDLRNQRLLCGGSSNTIVEEVARIMREAFNVQMDLITSGTLAGMHLREHGHGRDYEDFIPSAFTPTPQGVESADADGGAPIDSSIPAVPWVAKSVDIKDFLGNEFLMWLWWCTETNEGAVPGGDDIFLAIDKTIDLECAWDVSGKTGIRRDGPTLAPEAADALQMGKWPRKIGMLLSDGEFQWELSVQGDKMLVGGAALPKDEEAATPREVTEARLVQTRKLAALIDTMYESFLKQRVAASWKTSRQQMGEWIKTRGTGRKADLQPKPEPVPV